MSTVFQKSDGSAFKIAVLGGGTAGWMAATLLAARWGRLGAEITVVEAPDVGIIGVGEGSTPQLKHFFQELGLKDADWMPRCNATYKNGISFYGWSEKPGYEGYFHPFPATLDTHTSPAFFFNSHFRRQGFDLEVDPNRFFLSARLAANKQAPLAAEPFPFDMPYGYHFDAYLVGAMLRDHAVGLGVRHIEAHIEDADCHEDGSIMALTGRGGARIEADFFLDCSGFRSLLLQQKLGVKFHSFADNLFNDSAVVMPTPNGDGPLVSETTATAMKAGWAWAIPLTNRTGNGYVFSSKYIDKDAAETELRAHLGLLDSDVEARHLSMKVGRVDQHWAKNCLAVGLSQGFIEPLEATALHVVQATVDSFMLAFEQGEGTPEHAEHFNAVINARFDGIRDYIVAHYRASLRSDTQYWRDNAANTNLSPSLTRILDCWFRGGDLKREIAEQDISKFYTLTSWVCLLGGYGNYPDKKDTPPSDLQRFEMEQIDEFIRRAALNFPDHREALTHA